MSIRTFKNVDAALVKRFATRFGLLRSTSIGKIDDANDNGYAETWRNAADTGNVEGIRVDSNNQVHLGGAPVRQPMYRPLIFNAVANAGVATRPFHVFTSTAYGKIVGIQEIHGTAGGDASAVTGHITKERGTQAPGAGVSLMSGTFNLKATADTRQTATLASDTTLLEFAPGDRLSFKLTGTATSCANVFVVVWVQYYTNIFETSVYLASGDADTVFFLSNRKYPLVGVSYVHGTAEETTTGLNVELKIQDGTETEAQGTDILTNNSNAGFDCLAAANTVQNGTFTALSMLAGERLSMTYDGTATELADVVMTVAFTAQPGRLEVSHFDPAPAATDHCVFLANRNYRLYDGRQIHGTAAGGTSTMQLEKAVGTGTLSSGTALLGTAWNLESTADTVQVLAPITVVATLQLDDGDRLAHDFGHAIQSSTNFAATYSLMAE